MASIVALIGTEKKMKTIKISIVVAASAFASFSFGQAFDWETVAPGTYSSVTMTNGGNSVTVSPIGATNPAILVSNPSVALLGSLSGSAFNAPVTFGNNRAQLWDFVTALSSVTFVFGDNGGDDDGTVTIRAYDSANAFLGQGTKFYGFSSVGDGITLSFANMDHFEFTTNGGVAHSMSAEVKASTPVPEPASMCAIALGIAGIVRRRRNH